MWVNILYCFTKILTNCSSNIAPFYLSLSCLCWSLTIGILGILWVYVVQSISRVWLSGLQQPKLPCPSLSPGACSNSCPLSWWCHPIISSSVTPFSSCCQSFPASGSFPMSCHFISSIYTVTHVFLCFVLLYAIFPFSYSSWGSQGKNTEVVCHSLLQWTTFWPPDAKNWLIWKDPDAGKDWQQEEKGTTEDEMVGWQLWLNGHEFE